MLNTFRSFTASTHRAAMAPVPIALCGKNPNMASSFAQSMLPEYEGPYCTASTCKASLTQFSVVHHFQSTAAARKELPALLRGEAFHPESDVGSDARSSHTGERKIPRAIAVGLGFSKDEVDEMRKVEGADQVAWLYPDKLKSAASALAGPVSLYSSGLLLRCWMC
jgi:hypothetical protein